MRLPMGQPMLHNPAEPAELAKKALLLESKSNQPVSISVNLTYRSIEDRFLIGLLNLRPLLLEPFRHGRCHY